MSSSEVQYSTNSNSAMDSLNRQIVNLSLENSSSTSVTTRSRLNSQSPVSLQSGQTFQTRRHRSQESADTHRCSQSGERSGSRRRNQSISPGPRTVRTVDDSSHKVITRKSRAGTYIVERDNSVYSKESTFTVPSSSNASALGDTMKTVMSTADSYGKPASSGSSGAIPNGYCEFSMPDLNDADRCKEYTSVKHDYISETESIKANYDSKDPGFMFEFSDPESILTQLGIKRHGDMNNQHPITESVSYDKDDTESYEPSVQQSGSQKQSYTTSSVQQVADSSIYSMEKKSSTESKPAIPPSEPRPFDFNSTDLAAKIRCSLQSEFLSSELSRGNEGGESGEGGDIKPSERSIDDILRDYGIVNSNTTTSLSKGIVPNPGKVSVTSNNDTNFSAKGGRDFSNKDSYKVSTPTNSSMNFTAPPTSMTNFVPRSDSTLTKSYTSFTQQNSITSTGNWQMNLSQNNETITKSASNAATEDNDVRRFGSPVDSTTSTVNYAPSNTMGRYDYGKTGTAPAASLPGDSPYTSVQTKRSTTDPKQFESPLKISTSIPSRPGTTSVGRPDIAEPSTSMGSNFELISSIGSVSDALGYSLLQERQRLRNIDSLIRTTPLHYRDISPRPYASKFLTEERSRSFGRTGLDGYSKLYSSPTLPTTSTYSSTLSHRSSYAGSIGQRYTTPTTDLPKSVSVPAYNSTPGKYGSSVDATHYGSSNNYRPSADLQHNNASYNHHVVERLLQEREAERKQNGAMLKKPEIPQRTRKVSSNSSAQSGNARTAQKPKAGSAAGNAARTKTPADRQRYGSKSATRNPANKKASQMDFNVSRSGNDFVSGFDFVKELNRMWQQAPYVSSESSYKPKQKPPKYQPYKPKCDLQPERPNTAAGVRGAFCKDISQQPPRKSQSYWTAERQDAPNGMIPTRDDDSASVDSVSQHSSEDSAHVDAKKGRFTARKGKKRLKSSTTSGGSGPRSILKSSGVVRPKSAPGNKTRSTRTTCGQASLSSYSNMNSILTPLAKKLEQACRPRSATTSQKKDRRL